MTQFDDYYRSIVRALFLKEKIHRVKIQCGCSALFIANIPQELMDGGAIPILTCPKCGRDFVIYHGEMTRLENFKVVDGVLIPKSAQKKPMQPTSKADN